MKTDLSLEEFIKTFDFAENALSMRNLRRWNGRSLLHEENLSEHTHLVIACAIKIYRDFNLNDYKCRFEKVVLLSLIHDSLEMLRGDILSPTKERIPGLKDFVDKEESYFENSIIGNTINIEEDLVELADLMARHLFIESELKSSTNEFVYEAYENSRKLYLLSYKNFITWYGFQDKYNLLDDCVEVDERFVKGYENDAGIDVILDKDVEFLPHSTQTFDLSVKVTPKPGQMAVLCARTSAASQGLSVAMCPIDPDFTGNVMGIVHNISNKIIKYKKGESFCQVVYISLSTETVACKIKKPGRRTDGKLGSTGR